MRPDSGKEDLDELELRLKDAGIRLRSELLPVVLDDFRDMKRHLAVVRTAVAAMTIAENLEAEHE